MYRFLLAVIFSFYFSFNAQEEKRLALVIGNANYDKGALKNPVNDAALMKQTLEKLNFDVIYSTNLERDRDMKDKIIEFGKKRGEYDVGFIYYAGHGVQIDGENYLLPTKELFNCEDDVLNYGVSVQTIMKYLKMNSNSLNVLVLDACRNNALKNTNCLNGTRSLNNGGLAKIVAPIGSLIAFSTSANKTANDGKDDNSIYCKSLSKYMLVPNKTLNQVFQSVRADVIIESEKIGAVQEPEENSKLINDYYFIKKNKEMNVSEIATYLNSLDDEKRSKFLKDYLKNNIENNDFKTKQNHTSEDYFALGYKSMDSENYSESINYFDKCIELDPSEALAYVNRAYSKLSLEDYRGAIEDCNRATELDPSEALAYVNRSNAKLSLEDYNGAIEDCNRAIELDPSKALAYVNRSNAKLSLEDYNGAIEDCNRAIELDPSKALAYVNRSNAKLSLEDYNGAIEDCNRAIELDPSEASAYVKRASVNILLNNFYNAISDCKKAFDLAYFDSDVYAVRGFAKMSLGDYKGATLDYNKAIELDSSESLYYAARSELRLFLEDYEGGLLDCKKAIELNPNESFNYLASANIKIKLENYKGAIKDCNKAIDLSPNVNDFYITLVAAMIYLKDYEGAITVCDKAIKLSPNQSLLYFNRASAFYELKDYERSLSDCNKALGVDPNSMYLGYFYAQIGLSKFKLGISYCDDLKKACDLGVTTFETEDEDFEICKIFREECRDK